jgi:pimeloyl-ACP methyl ester carboxylesterase
MMTMTEPLSTATDFSASAHPALPSSFQAKTIHSPADAEIFVRYGGHGPVVVLIHGYAENSDSWGPLAADLMKDHTVIVPDLRGIGRSTKTVGGYDKKTQAQDISRRHHRPRLRQDLRRRARHRQHGRLRLRRHLPR